MEDAQDPQVEARYRRLLRWYPKAWRDRNGAVVLGTMLDEAEARGQERPDARLCVSAAVHGLAERLTPTLAIVLSGIALVGSAVYYWLYTGAVTKDDSILYLVVSMAETLWASFFMPGLVAVAVVALVRVHGRVGAPHAIGAIGLVGLALTARAVAAVLWRFLPLMTSTLDSQTSLQQLLLLAFAWVLAASACALILERHLSLVRAPRWIRTLLALVIAAAAVPVIVVFFEIPFLSFPAAAVLVWAIVVRRGRGGRSALAEGARRRRGTAPEVRPDPRLDRVSLIAASGALIAGIPGFLDFFMLLVFPFSIESSFRMAFGDLPVQLAIGAAMVVALAWGLEFHRRLDRHPLNAWVPVALIWADALFVTYMMYFFNSLPLPEGIDSLDAFATAGFVGGAGLLWMVFQEVRLNVLVKLVAVVVLTYLLGVVHFYGFHLVAALFSIVFALILLLRIRRRQRMAMTRAT